MFTDENSLQQSLTHVNVLGDSVVCTNPHWAADERQTWGLGLRERWGLAQGHTAGERQSRGCWPPGQASSASPHVLFGTTLEQMPPSLM